MRAARPAVGLTALLVTLVPATAPAVAQSGDPAAGSPSGVIYEIPLDNARQDAAPATPSGGSGNGGGSADGQGTAGAQGGTRSPIRSENGFGSSSTVPGAATPAAAKSRSGGGGSGSGGTSGTGRSGTGARGSAGTPGTTSAAAAESLGGARGASITPSKSRAYLLLLLALVVAAGLGLAGRYVAQRR